VVALIAPRPYLALTGELDAGSPADGVRMIETKAGQVYSALGAPEKFKSVLYPGNTTALKVNSQEAVAVSMP
jgi:hypothetical protein